jgi:bifunctional UDP-N-acetylglucosamine pyrophosphorylase/glucosamine-1-phosphate N-acetyltransferase
VTPHTLHPITRPLAGFPIGNRPLAEYQAAAARAAGSPAIGHDPAAWLELPDLRRLSPDGPTTLVGDDARPIAWLGGTPDPQSTTAAESSFLIVYPWHLLRANELAVGSIREAAIHGEVHDSAVVDGTLQLGAGSRILPGVFIEGSVVIGRDCKIGPNCYLRGATAIGDRCHIGQAVEIKNSLILSATNVGHLSYLGDSVLGEKVNFGAGTIVSNLRHDGANHRTMVGGNLVDTGRRKFGTIVGDGVHTGIHTSIYPGRKLGPRASTRPGQVVDRDIP